MCVTINGEKVEIDILSLHVAPKIPVPGTGALGSTF